MIGDLQLKEDLIGVSANVYVCHPWGSPFSDVVKACEDHEKSQNTGENNLYWLDVVVFNQWRGEEKPFSRPKTWWSDTVKGNIQRCGRLLLVWGGSCLGPVWATRAWCLLEVLGAFLTETPLSVYMPEPQRREFQKILRARGPEQTCKDLSEAVSMREAKCSDVFQTIEINGVMSSREEEQLNRGVTGWVLGYAQNLVSQDTTQENRDFMQQIVKCLFKNDKIDEAKQFFSTFEARLNKDDRLGDDFLWSSTLERAKQLANAPLIASYKDDGKQKQAADHKEAEILYRQVLLLLLCILLLLLFLCILLLRLLRFLLCILLLLLTIITPGGHWC
jgi:hypothetical protein